METRPGDLRDRTKALALRVISLFRSLPYRTDSQVLGKQLLRCGTSVAANYRATCRARSKAEFVARIGVVAEEADEAVLWLELLTESEIISPERTKACWRKQKNSLLSSPLRSKRPKRRHELEISITQLPNYAITRFQNHG